MFPMMRTVFHTFVKLAFAKNSVRAVFSFPPACLGSVTGKGLEPQDTGACEKTLLRIRRPLGMLAVRKQKSVPGGQFLLLDCMAKAFIQC